MESIVRLPAVLRNPDVQSKCILEVWLERSSTGRTFSRCRITGDSPELPDGPYEVVFAEHSVKTRKVTGCWELVFIPAEIGIELLLWRRDVASQATQLEGP